MIYLSMIYVLIGIAVSIYIIRNIQPLPPVYIIVLFSAAWPLTLIFKILENDDNL
jgi:hypothetical protein